MEDVVVFWSKCWLLLEKWVDYSDNQTKSSRWIVSSATLVFKVTDQYKRLQRVLTLHILLNVICDYFYYMLYSNIMGIYFLITFIISMNKQIKVHVL